MSSEKIQACPPQATDTAFRAAAIQSELETCVNPEKREYLPRFFKTGKGEYGEGDQFLGVVVPDVRRVAKAHKDESLAVAGCLLQSPWHECRLCALLMLVERFRKATSAERQEIFDFYLAHTVRINNWDLVDLSAPYIVGEYLVDKPRSVLRVLAQTRNEADSDIKAPTLTSIGIDCDISTWFGLIAPKNTPLEVRQTLFADIQSALSVTATAEKFAQISGGGAKLLGPEAFEKWIAAEQVKYASILKTLSK